MNLNHIPSPWAQAYMTATDSQRRGIHVPHSYVDINDGYDRDAKLFAQVLYWYLPSKKTGEKKVTLFRDGYYWVAKRHAEWYEDARIRYGTVRRVLDRLQDRNLIVYELHGFAGEKTPWIRINWQEFERRMNLWMQYEEHFSEEPASAKLKFDDLIAQFAQKVQGGDNAHNVQKVQPICAKSTASSRKKYKPNTETTTETTGKTTIKDSPAPASGDGQPANAEPNDAPLYKVGDAVVWNGDQYKVGLVHPLEHDEWHYRLVRLNDGWLQDANESALTPAPADPPSPPDDAPAKPRKTAAPKDERKPDKVAKPRKRSEAQLKLDGMCNAIAAAFEYDTERMTNKAWSPIRGAAKELLDAEYTSDDVPAIYQHVAKLARKGKWSTWGAQSLAKYAPDWDKKSRKESDPPTPPEPTPDPEPEDIDTILEAIRPRPVDPETGKWLGYEEFERRYGDGQLKAVS